MCTELTEPMYGRRSSGGPRIRNAAVHGCDGVVTRVVPTMANKPPEPPAGLDPAFDRAADAGRFRVTTTAAALLALLDAGPLPTGEWLHGYHGAFGHCWDRTNALLYEQIRRLQARGLVSESAEGSLRRHRLTPAGRRALLSWSASEPKPPRIDLEVAVRLIVDDSNDTQPDHTIAVLASWASEQVAALDRMVTAGPSDRDGATRAVDLVRRLYRTVEDWAMEQTAQDAEVVSDSVDV
jgi:DNA-binding PadR family transcriptional regulator